MNLNLIHQDKRGQIFTITGEGLNHPEVTMFLTNDGFARGGCVHNLSTEYCTVVSGKVEYIVGDKYHVLWDGDSITIPAGTPHYFTSFGNSVVMEWGATEDEKKVKHQEYRLIVDRINDSAN